MTTKRRKTYLEMTEKEQRDALRKRNMPEWLIDQSIETTQRLRRERMVEAARKKAFLAEWAPVTKPLRAEINNAKAGSAYRLRNVISLKKLQEQNDADGMPLTMEQYTQMYHSAREEAFGVYVGVMQELLSRIEVHMENGRLPKEVAQEKNYPNNGLHWSDWVPEVIKNRVRYLFNRLPDRTTVRTKEPFKRHVPASTWVSQHDRLIKATQSEMATVNAQINAVGAFTLDTKEGAEAWAKLQRKLKLVTNAQFKLRNIAVGEPLPRTWHGLFPKAKFD